MIRYHGCGFHPRIDMDVLVLCLLGYALRHVHVVELLCVHVEEIGIALLLFDFDFGVEILEAAVFGICLQGLDEGEFVEVACRDYAGFLVLGEDTLQVGSVVVRSEAN